MNRFPVPSMRHGGGGVMGWGCFAGDTLVDVEMIYLEFKAHLTSMATTAFFRDMHSSVVCT